MPYPDTDRDLDTVEAIGPLIEDGEYQRATPCIRLTFVTDGNLAARHAVLDDWLTRAAELVRPEVTLYGGEGQVVPASQRRKPKPADWQMFPGLSERLRDDMQQRAEAWPAGIPQENGSFIFCDTLNPAASATRLIGKGSYPWRFTVALSPALWRRNRVQMNRLVEDLAAMGDIYDSGGYGFAMNTWDVGIEDIQAELFAPISQRFQLIDMVDPMRWRHSMLDALGAGGAPIAPLPPPMLYPILPWALLGKAPLSALDIPHQAIRDLAPDVHEVVEHQHGFLVKLWPEPILGDVNTDPDLSPAMALGRALAPAILPNRQEFAQGSAAPLGWPETAAAWYGRFCPAPRDQDETGA